MLQPDSFREVVALWPSADRMASDIGAPRDAVRKWPQRNNIPAEWWSSVLSTPVAREAGLSAELFARLASRMALDNGARA